MTHKFSSPTDSEIEELITQVFEGMLKPEQSRLSLIETNLLRETRKNKSQKNMNKIPWWLVLVLIGSFASAAWWTGNLFIDKQNMEISEKQTISSDKINERHSGINSIETKTESNEQKNRVYEDKDSPVIYQRESF